jgi:hypothetical protein
MTRQWLLALSLGSLVGTTWAQTTAPTNNDDVGRRNGQINRDCKSIIKAKFNYGHLTGSERESKERQHSADIEACYSTFKIANR